MSKDKMITDSDFDREFKKMCNEVAKQNGKDFNSLHGDAKESIEFLAYEGVEADRYEPEWLDYFDRKRREYRKKNNLERQKAWAKNNRAKVNAQAKLRYAVKTGKIKKPNICSSCGLFFPLRKIQSHHKDYKKPLDVEWFCPHCHRILKHGYISF